MKSTLLIGLGGTGLKVLSNVYESLSSSFDSAESIDRDVCFLGLDIDSNFARDQRLHLPDQYILPIDHNVFHAIRQHCDEQPDEKLPSWFDCEAWRGMTGTPNVSSPIINRQLGRLGLWHDYLSIRERLVTLLTTLRQQKGRWPLVAICTSLNGGMGSSIVMDIAYLIQNISQKIDARVYILGVFALADMFHAAIADNERTRDRHIAFNVAAVKEIQYFARSRYAFGPNDNTVKFEAFEPFNSYWLIGDNRQWPNEVCLRIGSELTDVIASENWVWLPQSNFLSRVGEPSELAYKNVPRPLIVIGIDNWSQWEIVYRRYLEDQSRPSPHISREFNT